jgi:hypothetical protein
MRPYWPDAVDMLKRYGAIVDIGQVSLRDRRRLARLAARGVVVRDYTLSFPRPRTRWTWIGDDAAA